MFKVPYRKVKLGELLINLDEPIAFDSETVGLYGKIRLAQFFQEGWDEVLLVEWPDPYELAAFLDTCHIIMHNGHYDITTIQANTETRWEPNKWDDTFYLARLYYYNKEKFSLDEVMTYALDYDPYEAQDLDKKLLQKSNWGAIALTTDQLTYAATDVFYLFDVWHIVKVMTEDSNYKLDKLILSYSLDFQNNGFPVEGEKLQLQFEDNLDKIESYNLPINVNSYKQVRPYIGSINSDGLGLATLAILGNTKAKEVNIVRKLIKQNSFLSKFDTMDGRIYGKFQPSARSGRFTCRDQNLEQLPRKLKKIFGLPTEEGRVLVYSDYPQIELRSITCITGETRMEKLFRELEDLHTYTAIMLFGEDYTKDQRQIAKTCNFALLYGAGWKVLQAILITTANMLLEEHVLRSIIHRWKTLWSAIAAWQDQGISAWRHGQAWATPFGRRYVAKMMTDQLNIKNQGFAAEIAKLAMHYMVPKIKAIGGIPVQLVNFVHDSYIFECDIGQHEEVAEITSVAMQEAWFEALKVGKDLKIRDLPMPINTFAGYNWGDIEKGNFIYEHKLIGMEAYERL